MRINIIIAAAILAANFAHGQLGMVPAQPNSPFSAEIVSTQVQTLADGTHITQPERMTKIYRDSLGRTRSETTILPIASPEVQAAKPNILIVDPVDGVEYFLNATKKTAQRTALPKRAASPSGTQGSASQAGIGSVQAVTPSGTSAGTVNGGPAAGSGGPSAPMNETTTAVGRRFSCPNPCPGAFTGRNENLGTQTMEGLVVEGFRRTRTYAEGNIGNDREVVLYDETWRSAELGMTVLSKNVDPRTGERTTRMINISRSEPDPALFQVPPDYMIEERPGPGGPSAGAPASGH